MHDRRNKKMEGLAKNHTNRSIKELKIIRLILIITKLSLKNSKFNGTSSVKLQDLKKSSRKMHKNV